MNPAFAGALCALALGSADFAGRFSTRALGAPSAWLGTLVAGTIVLTVWIAATDAPLAWNVDGLPYAAANGIATTVMTLLLYMALARGPVSVAAPIVGSHPVLVVAFWVLLGARPSAIQWLAMAVTILGAVIVARSVEGQAEASNRSSLRITIGLACASCLAYAVLVIGGQAAAPHYGPLETLWLGRLFSIASVLAVFAFARRSPTMPLRWWPFLGAQGLLDASGYLALFAGSTGEGQAIAAVAGSGFGAVTVLLARVILKERMGLLQWLGIVLVFAGVAVLASQG
ncbi:MAG: EamA family transporter [Alphaproteobacteria bacterium]